MRIRFFNTFEPVTCFYGDLLPFLAGRGTTVEVLISSSEYRSGRGSLDQFRAHPSIQITHLPGSDVAPRDRWQKLWVMLGYMLGAALRTLFGPRSDLNFFLTQPPLFSAWGYLLRAIRRQRYVCLVMDVYPDLAVRDGLLNESAFSTRCLTTISRFVLKRADAVIVIGRCMQEYLLGQGIPRPSLHLIPNWANETEVFPVPRRMSRLRRELGVEDDFIVLYSGNVGTSHFFEDLLEVARRLRETANLRFVFIGDGIRRREIEYAKSSQALHNVILVPFQPAERLADSLSLGDVHFVSLRAGFEGLVVPSKAYGALAAGRPIIYQGSETGEIARLILEENVGAVVRPDDPDALERVIVDYYQDATLVVEQGHRARELAKGRLSHKRALEMYYDLLCRAAPHHGPDQVAP